MVGRCDLVVSYRLWVDKGAGSMLSRLAVCRGEVVSTKLWSVFLSCDVRLLA